MPKIGRYKYPSRGLEDTLIEVKKAETALKQGISRRRIAEALGMKWGGAFFHKVADMRMFGLIEGRGTLKLTDLADTILHGYSKEMKQEAREKAWLNIDAISMVHEVFKGKIPERREEYLALLAEKSGEKDRAKLPKKAIEVLNLYKEALSDILVEKIPEEVEEITTVPAEAVLPSTFAVPPGIIEIKAGTFYQRLPWTSKGIDIAIDFLNLLKIQTKEKEAEKEEEQ